MKISYDSKTDSLYIDLNGRASAESREVVDGVVLDLDASGVLVGIDIEHASKRLDLTRLETDSMPSRQVRVA